MCSTLFSQKISNHFGKSDGDFRAATHILEHGALRAAIAQRDAAGTMKHHCVLLCKYGPDRRLEDLSTWSCNCSLQCNVLVMFKGRGEEEAGKESWRLAHLPDQSQLHPTGRDLHRSPSPSHSSEDAEGPGTSRSRSWHRPVPPAPRSGSWRAACCADGLAVARVQLCWSDTQGLHSRRTRLADSLGRAGVKDTHSCCPRVRLYPPALIPTVIPLHNRHSVGDRVAPCLPGWPRGSDPCQRSLPCSKTGCCPWGGDDGRWGLQAQVAGPAAGFRFPIDSGMAPGYVRKAGKAEQALARTEVVVSSADVEPMGYPICHGECPLCLSLQTLSEILSAFKNIGYRKTMVFLFHFSSRISSCSKLSSRNQPVAAHHLAAEVASPEVLLMSLLTDTAIPIFIFMDLCKECSSNLCPTFSVKVIPDCPTTSVPRAEPTGIYHMIHSSPEICDSHLWKPSRNIILNPVSILAEEAGTGPASKSVQKQNPAFQCPPSSCCSAEPRSSKADGEWENCQFWPLKHLKRIWFAEAETSWKMWILSEVCTSQGHLILLIRRRSWCH